MFLLEPKVLLSTNTFTCSCPVLFVLNARVGAWANIHINQFRVGFSSCLSSLFPNLDEQNHGPGPSCPMCEGPLLFMRISNTQQGKCDLDLLAAAFHFSHSRLMLHLLGSGPSSLLIPAFLPASSVTLSDLGEVIFCLVGQKTQLYSAL